MCQGKWKEQHMGCAEANWAQPSCVCCSWPQWKGVFACPKRFSKQVVPRKSRLMVWLHSQVLGWQCSLESCIWLFLVSQHLLPAGREVTLLWSDKWLVFLYVFYVWKKVYFYFLWTSLALCCDSSLIYCVAVVFGFSWIMSKTVGESYSHTSMHSRPSLALHTLTWINIL